jgi:D-3-phosphoglycerate dehydrogenase / 2-oxoglutarate reductase
MQIKCLIVDTMHESILMMLPKIGVTPFYKPYYTKQEALADIADYEGIMIRSKFFIDNEFLEKAPKLKFIARAGAGIDNLDVTAIEKRGIHIINAPEGNRDAVAEHAIAMLLVLMNKIRTADIEVRNGVWDRERNRGYELKGKTVALLGYGHMGEAFAKRLSSFECNVIAYDKYKTNFSDDFVKEVSMEQIYAQADILSLHIPLTTETKSMIDVAYFNKFKKNIWFLNTARGEIVENKAILEGIDSGKVIAAALDVLENEKIANLSLAEKQLFEGLIKSDKVLLTPHVAGWSYESYIRINEVLTRKIVDFINKSL